MPSKRLETEISILVAEGNAGELKRLTRHFGVFQLTNVETTDEGYKALHKARFQSFGLMLLGSTTKKINATKMVSTIRAEGKNKDTPIIFIGGPNEDGVLKEAVKAGASGTLKTPVEEAPLRKLIEEVLDRYILTKGEEKKQAQEYESTTSSGVDRGKLLLEQGDYEGAEEAFEEAMVTGGGSFDVFFGLAEVYLYQGKKEEAEQVLVEAERLEPLARDMFRGRSRDFMERGRAKMKKEEFEGAKLDFQTAAEADKESVAPFFELCKACLSLEDSEGAEKYFSRGMSLPPKAGEFQHYNSVGIFLRRVKELDLAALAFERAIRLAPDDPVIYYNKTLVHVVKRESEEALSLVNKALELNLKFSEADAVKVKIEGWMKSVNV